MTAQQVEYIANDFINYFFKNEEDLKKFLANPKRTPAHNRYLVAHSNDYRLQETDIYNKVLELLDKQKCN